MPMKGATCQPGRPRKLGQSDKRFGRSLNRKEWWQRNRGNDEENPMDTVGGPRSGIAQAAVRGERTQAELAQQFDAHPNQRKKCRRWKSEGLTLEKRKIITC
ncbi:hypothetical protein BN2475_860008 [Paraburkholderia ribeironis]|uniref:Uncharacterized protein n=1 Tax=Paraburkholderia ribeironis TaxID=1247936 RepID=A0A1N7SKJ6_9BURK|nr:hypothetical protein BN2475_860008 [Paraburkholderia ribeironis]